MLTLVGAIMTVVAALLSVMPNSGLPSVTLIGAALWYVYHGG